MADIECLLHSGPSEGLKIRLFGGNNLPPLIEIGNNWSAKIGTPGKLRDDRPAIKQDLMYLPTIFNHGMLSKQTYQLQNQSSSSFSTSQFNEKFPTDRDLKKITCTLWALWANAATNLFLSFFGTVLFRMVRREAELRVN